eukprot:gene2706-biopygen4321
MRSKAVLQPWDKLGQPWMQCCCKTFSLACLHTHNTYVQQFKDLPNLPDWELIIRTDGSVDRRRYNAPTGGEVAGFMPGDGEGDAAGHRDIQVPFRVHSTSWWQAVRVLVEDGWVEEGMLDGVPSGVYTANVVHCEVLHN